MGANFVRSVLVAGVATVTVGAAALSMPPTVSAQTRENIPVPSAFSLTARSTPLSASLPSTLPASIELGSLEPEVLELVESTSINSAIKNIYNAVEPWVAWGFELAQYVVGWIPVAGYFAPQITILYNFGESIVQSVVFNLDDWIFGPLPFFDGLRNVISDTWDASWNLLWNEITWLLPPLPPLPPIPPCPSWLCGAAAAEATVAAVPHAEAGPQPWDSLVSLLKFQTDAARDLSQTVGDALASFAKDILAAGGQAVTDFFEHGLFTAAANAITATWQSIVLRTEQAAGGFAEYADAQHDYFSATSTTDKDATSEDADEAPTPAVDKPVAAAVVDSDAAGDSEQPAAGETELESADEPASEAEPAEDDAEPGADPSEGDLDGDDGGSAAAAAEPADDGAEQDDAEETPSDTGAGEADDTGDDDAGAPDSAGAES